MASDKVAPLLLAASLGAATDGPLAGEQLEPVVHGDHFLFAWAAIALETTIWTARRGASS